MAQPDRFVTLPGGAQIPKVAIIDSDGDATVDFSPRPGATFLPAQVAIDTVPKRVLEVWTEGSGAKRRFIKNAGTSTAYFGPDAAVTPDTGYPLSSGESMEVLWLGETWAVLASSTGRVAHFCIL